MSTDYFIKPEGISAYTINAFVEAIVETTKAGQSIDYNSARRIGTSFSVSFAQEGESVETQAPAQEEAPESPAQPEASAEDSVEQSEGESEEPVSELASAGLPFTLEDIENAKDSMEALKELAEPADITGRSKKDLVRQLKAYIGE